MGFALAFFALLTEALAGYPGRIAAWIGHPVGWMSALVRRAEAAWKDLSLPLPRLRLRGTLALATVLLVTLSCVLLLDRVLDLALPVAVALIVKGVLASALIAGRSLDERVSAVAEALDARGLDAGRSALGQIAERDTRALDDAGVARAAIESLAGGLSEGLVAPLAWLVVAGLPGCALYKAVSTAGGMSAGPVAPVPQRAYGWAASRFDDLVNWPTARLTALWLAAAARIMPGADWRAALLAALRDGPRHRTLNAGWPEAAMAGALGLALAGPTTIGGQRVDNAWMGAGRREATPADIHHALRLYRIAYVLQAATIGLLALIAVLVF